MADRSELEALAARVGMYYHDGNVNLCAPLYAFTPDELREFARRLQPARVPEGHPVWLVVNGGEVLKVATRRDGETEEGALKMSVALKKFGLSPTTPAPESREAEETEQSIKADAYDMIAEAFQRSGWRVKSIVEAVELMIEERQKPEAGQREGVEALVENWRSRAAENDAAGRVICAAMLEGCALELEQSLASAQQAGGADDLRRMFVDGAKWWEFTKTGGTMWQTDQEKAWQASEAKVSRMLGQRTGSRGVVKCWCETCRPQSLADIRFIVCPDCGNKRCPKATDHRNACTNSNEPGQPGSSWDHVKRAGQAEGEA